MIILCTVYNMHLYYDHTLYSLQYVPILWSYSVQFTICTYTMIILCTVYNMYLYYDHTLYSFPLHTFLWPEDGPQWAKHVDVSVINRIQDSCILTYPTPSLTRMFLHWLCIVHHENKRIVYFAFKITRTPRRSKIQPHRTLTKDFLIGCIINSLLLIIFHRHFSKQIHVNI